MKVFLSFFILVIAFGLVSTSSAHSDLFAEEKTTGNYIVSLEISGDIPTLTEDYPLTYSFRLLSSDQKKNVVYESAYIIVSKKTGRLIVQTEVVGPQEFVPDAAIDLSLEEPGDYVAEVIFIRGETLDDVPEVQAEFDFSVLSKEYTNATTTEIVRVTSEKEVVEERDTIPRYVWTLIVLILGVVIGRFSKADVA
jgi:hypothetical protein